MESAWTRGMSGLLAGALTNLLEEGAGGLSLWGDSETATASGLGSYESMVSTFLLLVLFWLFCLRAEGFWDLFSSSSMIFLRLLYFLWFSW